MRMSLASEILLLQQVLQLLKCILPSFNTLSHNFLESAKSFLYFADNDLLICPADKRKDEKREEDDAKQQKPRTGRIQSRSDVNQDWEKDVVIPPCTSRELQYREEARNRDLCFFS